MKNMIAFYNGEYVDQRELSVPVYDTGFMLGVTIAEQLRTFGGRAFQLDAHLERMARGLKAVGWIDAVPLADLPSIVQRVLSHNRKLIDPHDDLGVTVFVTPGPYPTYAPHESTGPTVCVHSYPLTFCLWAHKYRSGQPVQVVDVRQVSPQSWSPEIKCRSRMHYYLADQQARRREPEAVGLLLNESGCVAETSTANLVAYLPDEGLVSPPIAQILPGISLQFLQQLAAARQIPFVFRDLQPQELPTATEIMLTSTPYCLLPVTRLNWQDVADGRPGSLYETLIGDWSEQVEVPIVEQAKRFSLR